MRNIVQRILPDIKEEHFDSEFKNLAIDSIDLVSLRVEIENRLGKMIPNRDWLSFKNLNDIFAFCEKENSEKEIKFSEKTTVKTEKNRNYITMPQMCLEALSENWLFKESGDLHWDLLCKGLETSSSELKDDLGNRLYATFVRIRIDGNHNLSDFKENNPYEFDAELSRFGLGMFFSKINFKSLEKNIKMDMMTSFSIRKSTTNKHLTKSQPNIENCKIPQNPEFPDFGNEYRLIKKEEQKTLNHRDYIFNISDNQMFTREYSLNPYYDLNGVGLLYFAAYPVISDFCELQYFHGLGKTDWAENYFTIFRDVMYYANCDANDKIVYVLNSVEDISENRVKIQAMLYRKSDNKMMARIFTVKQKKH
ncbi:MAG: phosphopantetheine-binding protein [Flavobacteriaceae bacterium]|jgi:probable biosynthetic protein (TIGR04098 family)|nr:phosphopantetheine-binding protein [Flavobacteriaceae bacterium]